MNVNGLEDLRAKLKSLDKSVEIAIVEGMKIEAQTMKAIAQSDAPVRTGKLKANIFARVQNYVLTVGATVSYAVFQELGTRYIKPKYFIKNAVFQRMPFLINRINRAIEDAIRKESK